MGRPIELEGTSSRALDRGVSLHLYVYIHLYIYTVYTYILQAYTIYYIDYILSKQYNKESFV
jgi:hypothetical protein